MRTLATFSQADPAHLLRMRLEGSGIAAHVRDENTVTFASLAVGGVKVDVADEDYEAALAVLADESTDSSSTPPTPPAV
jgi:hypothetical protein